MRQKFTRLLSMLMVVIMITSTFMVPAFAAEQDTSSSAEEVESGSVMTSTDPTNQITEIQEENTPSVAEPLEPEFPAGESVSVPAAAASEGSEDGKQDPDEGDDNQENTETFTVSYYDSDKTTLLKTETVEKDAAPTQAPSASAWLDDDGNVVTLADVTVTTDVSFYAWYKPQFLNSGSSHGSYISGMGNGNFSPTSSLSRAAAASILYRLLEGADLGPYDSEFTDVPGGEWYSDSIAALASYGILAGKGNGKFSPMKDMTRAEFVSVLVRITGETGSGATSFTDVSTHWARKDIAVAAEKGWISGYAQTDGSYLFSPNKSITRAEAVSVINRVLGRANDKNTSDTSTLSDGEGIRHFLDVSESAWYYYAVMEASIAHTCTSSDSRESWIGYTRESCGLSAGFHQVGNIFCYVDSSGQPVKLERGINHFGNAFLYAPKAGYTATIDFSSGQLRYPSGTTAVMTPGIQRIKGTSYYYFYWDGTKNEPKFLSEGLNVINGSGYWADSDGFTIRGGLSQGTVVSLGEKNYMVQDECSILTSGYAHDGEESYLRVVDLRNKNFEYGNYMYHAMPDYSLATDYWYGYLYFGKDCRYTSGDSTVDGYVWNIVSDYVNLANQTQVQKLLLAYYRIRGGTGEHYGGSYGTSMFNYWPGGTLVRAGKYDRQSHVQIFLTCAKEMFKDRSGRCFQWAAAYHYVVRRLGFQSYLVVGEVWSTRNPHCWNMIKWSDTWHISDLELEWGHISGYYNGVYIYRDLFGMALSQERVSYYKNPKCDISYYFPAD